MRGEVFPLGHERTSQNGYVYVKTPRGWKLKHHLIAEKTLGRPINSKLELVKFKDGKRTNFDPDNIIVVPKKLNPAEKRLILQTQMDTIKAELLELDQEVS